MKQDPLTYKIIQCSITVHRFLGPGLLESTYQKCLAHELEINRVRFHKEFGLPVQYKGLCLDCGYRIDFLVENKVIVECKAVRVLEDIQRAQLLTYMKLGKIKTGLLINFNIRQLIQGIERFIL